MATRDYSFLYETQGIKANRCKPYTVELDGQRWYRYMQRLERRAIESTEFGEVVECVLDYLDIRDQLRRQGF